MKCPRCNIEVDGKEYTFQQEKWFFALKQVWDEGMKASLQNANLTQDDCPYDSVKDATRWVAWMGGMYHAKYKRIAEPEKVQKWLEERTRARS